MDQKKDFFRYAFPIMITRYLPSLSKMLRWVVILDIYRNLTKHALQVPFSCYNGELQTRTSMANLQPLRLDHEMNWKIWNMSS